ncbi:hypothetical protein O6H91_23G010300 [Diphasiastrum complanatum]|nr:hypothetical protein O6H91_23G010300 [Diphasiastrum complanatum]
MGSTQAFMKMRGPTNMDESIQEFFLQNELSKVSINSSGQGHVLPQVIESVEECQGMRDEDGSYYVKGSVVPLLGGTVWEGSSRPTQEYTRDTVMNDATRLAAAPNAPIASRQRTAEKVRQSIDSVEMRFLRVSVQENSSSKNYQEAQSGLRNKEHHASKQPTSSKEELFAAREQRKGNQMTYCCVPSADLMVVFSSVPWAGPKHVRVSTVSPKTTNFIPELMADSPLPLVGYESPLSGFRRHHSRLSFSAELESSMVSSSPSYAVNPFQPLCNFEHRGKCNDEDCPWQHRNEQASFRKALSQNLRWKDYVTQVPTYKIGNYVMGDDMDALTSVRYMIQRCYKHETSRTHLFSISTQRSFPLDMPCLLEPLKSPALWGSKYSGAFDTPSRRHSGDDFERRAYAEHVLREPGDVEAWLDVALNIMEYDLHKLDSNSEKNALFVLSRALEANPTSVSLWVVYLHTYYWHQKSLGKDDMFDHAVQQNRGSYELWLLYIHSRFHLRQRLDSFELAIIAICNVPQEIEFKSSLRSSQILDLVLQMFHCMCVSEQTQDAFSWVDDLCLDASASSDSDMVIPRRACTIAVLKALHPQDACILWVCCAYLLVCYQLPCDVIRRLGYKQHLLYGLNWMDQRGKSEVSDNNALRLFQIATSNGIGHLDSNSSSSIDENILLARQSLVVNYVQYMAVVKGPEQAAMLGQQFMSQFPRCVELVVLCARIKQQHSDVDAALSVFEEALLRWPINLPGSLRLWNQYAGHALEWKGKESASLVLCKCAYYTKGDRRFDNSKRATRLCVSSNGVVETFKELAPHFDVEVTRGALQSKCHRVRTSGVHEAISVQETAFALLNLALFEALHENFEEAEIVVEKVIDLSLDEEFMHCWREFLALKFLISLNHTGPGGPTPLYETLIHLFDRCYLCAQLLPKPNLLSKQFLESFKKRRVRCFFENLLGAPPLDSSLFNSILETYFGPELLPREQYSFSDSVDFYGGLLEFIPSNVELALAFCRAAFHNCSSKEHPSSVAFAFWAASMLTYSLFHSYPLAPEVHWVKAGVFLEDLGVKDAVQQFYNCALLSYPFSSALWRSFIAFSSRCGDRAAAVQAANDRGLVLD